MNIWNSIVKLLWKLQCFHWLGSAFWSLLPVPLAPLLILNNSADVTSGPITVLGNFNIILIALFLAMLPQSIFRFRECIKPVANERSVTPQNLGNLQILTQPPKMIWALSLTWLVLLIYYIIGGFEHPKLLTTMIIMAMITLLNLLYTLKFGIIFGSLTNTLALKCQNIFKENQSINFKRSKCILDDYKVLKKASQFGLFSITALSTIMTIIAIYSIVAVTAYSSCMSLGDPITNYLVPGLQLMGIVLTFLVFTKAADACHESFLNISEKLR